MQARWDIPDALATMDHRARKVRPVHRVHPGNQAEMDRGVIPVVRQFQRLHCPVILDQTENMVHPDCPAKRVNLEGQGRKAYPDRKGRLAVLVHRVRRDNPARRVQPGIQVFPGNVAFAPNIAHWTAACSLKMGPDVRRRKGNIMNEWEEGKQMLHSLYWKWRKWMADGKLEFFF